MPKSLTATSESLSFRDSAELKELSEALTSSWVGFKAFRVLGVWGFSLYLDPESM